jgi:hypothetical protein
MAALAQVCNWSFSKMENYNITDMTLPCENVTNFNGTQNVYIFIEAEPFDKFLLFKILQFLNSDKSI